MASREHLDRQARIAALERELGFEPVSNLKVSQIAHQIEQLAQQAEALLAESKGLRASPQPRASDDREQVMLDVDRQMARIARALQAACQELREEAMASASAPQERTDIRVITEGRNRWLVQIRKVEGEDEAEKVWEFRLAGRWQRKAARSLIEMARRNRSSTVREPRDGKRYQSMNTLLDTWNSTPGPTTSGTLTKKTTAPLCDRFPGLSRPHICR